MQPGCISEQVKCFRNCTPQSKAGRVISTLSPATGGISVRWHSMPSLFLEDINHKPAAISLFDNERYTHNGIYFCCVPCKCSGLCHNMVLIKLLKITCTIFITVKDTQGFTKAQLALNTAHVLGHIYMVEQYLNNKLPQCHNIIHVCIYKRVVCTFVYIWITEQRNVWMVQYYYLF